MTNEIDPLLYTAEEIMESNSDTTVCFGRATAMSQLAVTIGAYADRTVLFCGGGYASFHTSGVFDSVMTAIRYTDLNVPRYEGIPAEPDTDDVRKLVRFMAEEKPDAVIAAGGGSVLDAVKAAWLSFQSGMDVAELFGVNRASEKFPDRKFQRVFCIPTTSGTGSEVTPYSNIIDSASGVKCLISDRALLPSHAFVDPVRTFTMPPALTLATGTDALVHCIESLLNVSACQAHPETAEYAVTAVGMIVRALPEALKEGDVHEARELMSAAADIGGMCIKTCPTSLPHLCSFSFCGKAPHGAAVGALLIPFWNWYLQEEPVREQTMKLAGIFGGNSPEEIVAHCAAFLRGNGLEMHLGTLSGEKTDWIDRLAEDALRNPMKLASAPRQIRAENCREAFHQALTPAW